MPDLGNTSVLSPTDASNASGTMPSWNGSASPNTIDDAGRALQGAVAREWECRSFPASTGTAPSFVVAYTVAPAAIRSGQTYTFTAHAAAAGTDTVNINALGAKTIKKVVAGTKTNLVANDFYANDKIATEYDGTDLVWVNWPGSSSSAYTVNAQTEETAPAKGDFVGGYDISGTAERKFTIENVLEVVNDLTEDTSPDAANDFLLAYDASASGVKKVKPSNLSSTEAFTHIFKTASTGRSATVTLADDPDLVFTADASGVYVVELKVFVDSPAIPDFKFAVIGPSATGAAYVNYTTSGNGATSDEADEFSASTTYFASTAIAGAAFLPLVLITSRFVVGGSGGTVAFQWAQNTSNASATTVLSGSYLKYRKVA